MFVVIFGRPGCPYCVFANELASRLQNAGAIEGFRYVDIQAEGITKADLEKTIGRPVHTVPQIFIDETPIGGYTEFESYVRQHRLLEPARSV
ncbi:MAG: GrxA family glutaredoxin [Halomonas sp.]|uniref:GrxA family glutaredoxin n=1 Tax=Halomonas sp. TaxID=1486246 RepID=UPI001A0B768D|nr:GrxA family glutaredoxin [Halomonas sp.]MBE0488451.1 GrxA family glutaredoxin [Halomonas sp.]